jgi:hypothetical protein
VPLCPLQIPHGLIRDRTRASAVRGRRLTVWAMARPCWKLLIRRHVATFFFIYLSNDKIKVFLGTNLNPTILKAKL